MLYRDQELLLVEQLRTLSFLELFASALKLCQKSCSAKWHLFFPVLKELLCPRGARETNSLYLKPSPNTQNLFGHSLEMYYLVWSH